MNINRLVSKLFEHKQEDGRFPKEIFYSSAKLFGESCLELCVFRDLLGFLEVFLYRRPQNDPFWPSFLHIPGVRKLTTDTDVIVSERVVDELPFYVETNNMYYVNSRIFSTRRGTEFSDSRMVACNETGFDEFFYPARDLPHNLIEHHYMIIDDAINLYDKIYSWKD